MSGYAAEGKSVAASWDLDAGGVAVPAPARKRRVIDVELESGFGTPLLTPRARTRGLVSAPEDRSRTTAGEGDGDSPVKKTKESVKATRAKASSTKPAKENISAVHGRNEGDDGEDQHASKRLRQSDIQEFAHPLPPTRAKAAASKRAKKEAQPQVAEKKRRKVDVDEEHEHSTSITCHLIIILNIVYRTR